MKRDFASVAAEVSAKGGSVFYNSERGAVQATSCTGHLIAHLPADRAAVAELLEL